MRRRRFSELSRREKWLSASAWTLLVLVIAGWIAAPAEKPPATDVALQDALSTASRSTFDVKMRRSIDSTNDAVALATERRDSARFSDYERQAYAGDIYSQRAVAEMLSRPGTLRYSPIRACAWRMAILISGDQLVDTGDAHEKRDACEAQLDANELVAASSQAVAIRTKIEDRLNRY